MKADDWNTLGKALQSNSELLQELALSEDHAINKPDSINAGLGWLIAKGLIDAEGNQLFINSLLLDIGAQISIPGFERTAPDLEAALIKIERHSQEYLLAKQELAHAVADRHLSNLRQTVSRVTGHLRDECLATRAFIEGAMGYSSRPSETLRDIADANARLKRLLSKLQPFNFDSLRRIAQGDRVLQRLLTRINASSLLSSVTRRNSDFAALIDRLDALNLVTRKRNRFRLLLQGIDNYLLAGNTLNPSALTSDPANLHLLPAPAVTPRGFIPVPEQAGASIQAIESLLNALPPPSERTPSAPDEDSATTGPQSIPVGQAAVTQLEQAFIRPHLTAMIKLVEASQVPVSARRYWLSQGDPGIEIRHWLYALSAGYMQLSKGSLSRILTRYRLEYRYRPRQPHSGMRLAYDIELHHRSRHASR